MNIPPNLKPHSQLAITLTHAGLSTRAVLDTDHLLSSSGPDYLEGSLEELSSNIARALRALDAIGSEQPRPAEPDPTYPPQVF
jgi:hypothetical protein